MKLSKKLGHTLSCTYYGSFCVADIDAGKETEIEYDRFLMNGFGCKGLERHFLFRMSLVLFAVLFPML